MCFVEICAIYSKKFPRYSCNVERQDIVGAVKSRLIGLLKVFVSTTVNSGS